MEVKIKRAAALGRRHPFPFCDSSLKMEQAVPTVAKMKFRFFLRFELIDCPDAIELVEIAWGFQESSPVPFVGRWVLS